MRTVAFNGRVDSDGRLRFDLPVDLPPGPLEGVVVIQNAPRNGGAPHKPLAGILQGVVNPDVDIEADLKEIKTAWKKRLEIDP
jgi:hypothetical protein